MHRPPIIQLPPDVTPLEQKLVATSYAFIYNQIEDPLDKFIVAFAFDLGNNIDNTALAAGVCRKTIWSRHKKIKKMLRGLKSHIDFSGINIDE